MTESKSSGEGFDLDRLQQLVELMEKHDLREVKLSKGPEKWSLKRGPQEVISAVPMSYAPAPTVAAASSAAPAAPSSAGITAPAAPKEEAGTKISSPMVGTFYRAPSPEEPVFVKEGDRVSPDTVVCLIEAMKFFNPVKAECSGTITKILANEGDAVEFGQPLFQVKPE
ncbi:MAG: acetyl-CoA carboxylase biotin carboxyl carrier protein [Planctomycetaceae bacterium]